MAGIAAWLAAHRALDVWSVVHVLTALAAGLAPRRRAAWLPLIALAGGVAWELVEWSVVERWCGFHEPWANRWVGDLAADLLGGCGAWLVRTTGGPAPRPGGRPGSPAPSTRWRRPA